MNAAQRPRTTSVVESLQQGKPGAFDLLSERYGRGLRFLIQRRCPDHLVECYAAVIEAGVAAILRKEEMTDYDIPALLRMLFHKIASQYPVSFEPSDSLLIAKETVIELKERLSLFSPLQLEALRRFYVEGEAPSSVCKDLRMNSDQFDFIRKVAWLSMSTAAGLNRRPPQSDSIERRCWLGEALS